MRRSIALFGLDCLLLDCLLFGPHVPAHCDFGAQSWDIGKPPQKGLFIPVMFYQLSPSVRALNVVPLFVLILLGVWFAGSACEL